MTPQSQIKATIVITEDGAMHIRASRKGWVIEKRFSPAQALAVKDWLKSPEAWQNAERDELFHESMNEHTIAYSHETGEIILDPGCHHKAYYKTKRFDMLDEEAMAKLGRHLKRITPMPERLEEPSLPEVLPTPTAEQIANRTIFTSVGVPDGVGKYARPKQRFQQPATTAAKSKVLIDDILGDLLKFGLK